MGLNKTERAILRHTKTILRRTEKHAAKQQLEKQLVAGQLEDLPTYEPKWKRRP